MSRKKWRITKRGDQWVATSPPLTTAPAYPAGCCMSTEEWDGKR